MGAGLVAGFLWMWAAPAWAQSGILAGTAGAPGPAVSGSCRATKISFVMVETVGASTASQSYVDMPGTVVDFKKGGRKPSCVMVAFSAYTFAPLTRVILVRALLDGATVGSPTEVQFSGGDGAFARSHAFNFAFPSVTPGQHTIVIRWRSADAEQVFAHRRSVFVHHR